MAATTRASLLPAPWPSGTGLFFSQGAPEDTWSLFGNILHVCLLWVLVGIQPPNFFFLRCSPFQRQPRSFDLDFLFARLVHCCLNGPGEVSICFGGGGIREVPGTQCMRSLKGYPQKTHPKVWTRPCAPYSVYNVFTERHPIPQKYHRRQPTVDAQNPASPKKAWNGDSP